MPDTPHAPSAEPHVRRWTRTQYYHMADLGWFTGARVELIDGHVMDMTPQKSAHAVGIGKCDDALRAVFGAGFWIRIQLPLAVDPSSEPEPDLAVVPGRPGDYEAHPTTAVLVVEVSDTSIDHDRHKAGLYARAGACDYWIINLPDRQLEVFRNPVPDEQAPFGYHYSEHQVLRPPATIAPLAAPRAQITLKCLFD